MTLQYGDNGMGQRKVYVRMEKYKGIRTNVDDSCSGRPSIVTCVEVKEETDQRNRDN
jgi:hypothetical protein